MNLNATLFGMAVWFILLIVFAWKFIWPPLMTAIDDRRQKIADGLAEAEKGKAALADGETQKQAMLKEARASAAEVKTLNDKQIAASLEEAKAQARSEAERIIAAAHAQIEQEKQKAKDQLREQVAALAVVGAEKILQREINVATHTDMLNQLKGQL